MIAEMKLPRRITHHLTMSRNKESAILPFIRLESSDVTDWTNGRKVFARMERVSKLIDWGTHVF